MEKYLGECNLNTYFIYLNDIIVLFFHLKNMFKYYKAQRKKGICSGTKWKKNTCFPNNGIKPDPDKIAKVVILLCPTNPDEIRQFNWIQSKFYQRLYKDRRTFKQDDDTHFRKEPKISKAVQSLKLKEKPREFISITQETIPGYPITRKHLYFIH